MIKPKTQKELDAMIEGGKKLSKIKESLRKMVKPGVLPREIDDMAEKLILEAGGTSSFKKVKNYFWTTCINVNDGVVHGIPEGDAFKEGDLVSVDVGMFYKGMHTDTSFTVPAGEIDKKTQKFLEIGKEALNKAIAAAKPGNRVSHISRAMEEVFKKNNVAPVRDLTGHGVGKNLHESPQVPCYWPGKLEDGEILPVGAVLAIEAIYTLGSPDLIISKEDNWTIATKDGKIAGLFEETVAVGKSGPIVLTKSGSD